ncbi:MAG: 2-polyprenylphenol 6-hydroxylase [Alphaproteobacteria bacterium]
MVRTVKNLLHLSRAVRVLAAHRALLPDGVGAGAGQPPAHRTRSERAGRRLARALSRLGPSYIKLGQVLATRADMVGPDVARGLARLHDRMAAFSDADARATVAEALGAPVRALFLEFGPPVAAASIAQVHRAHIPGPDGPRAVAVKILRPGIEHRFSKDLASFYTGARMLERLRPSLRRLRPVEVVRTLDDSVRAELDLRVEASAAAEMAENTVHDEDFRVPAIDWERTARRVMTSEWIDGIPLNDLPRLRQAGLDLEALARSVLQNFLRHALRDGLFHADMHPGNLFADGDGRLVAVDFGIMGRLDRPTRRFMAETLYGFITRDYDRIAAVHFDHGYVPAHQSFHDFSLALRAIGEPIWGRPASEMSMARLLTQLFETTRRFDMALQPSLILLQKTMVVSEGVARSLDPNISIWTAARPVVEAWMEDELGAQARIRDAADTARAFGRLAARAPDLLADMERASQVLHDVAQGGGVRLHQDTVRAITDATARSRRRDIALMVGIAILAGGAGLALAGLIGG